MTDQNPAEETTLFPQTAGAKLREAREAQGLSLAEVAARTRVPVRQLEAIETDNYAALPSITYSVGFAKAYARAVDLDEVAIAREVRGASDQPGAVRRTEYQAYEIDEPSRVPPRGLAIGTLIAAVLLLIGVGLFYGTALFRGEDRADAPPAGTAGTATDGGGTDAPAPVAAPTSPAAAPTGPVVLTATDEVWLKVYDGAGKTLFLGTLKPGEIYTVPADAAAPLINVGRPDQLKITVGGVPVAALGSGKVAIKDVPIDAKSLTARGAPDTAITPTARPTAATPGAARPEARSETGPETRQATRTGSRPTGRASTLNETQRANRAAASSSAPLNIAAPVPVAPEPSSAPAP